MSALWQHGALSLQALYRRGDASPVEALRSVLERLQQVQSRLHPVATLAAEAALVAAHASEARWRRGEPLSALDGVPVSIKDNLPTTGLRSTWGSALYADHVPARDELPVARLRAAGALLFAKTNVPEFTLQGYTDNALFGATGNPWAPALTPGGSSGGAAAAVAAGVGPLALATDGGGSIRRPAGHCGLVGLKPTMGRVARADGFPAILLDFEVVGPLARTVADLLPLMDAIARPHASDPRSGPADAAGGFHVAAPPPRQRILHLRRVAGRPVDPVIDAAVAEVARRLAALGHTVETQDSFDLPETINQEVWPVLAQSGLAWLVGRHDGWQERVGAASRATAEAGLALPAAALVQALDRVAEAQAQLRVLQQRWDLLLTPTAAAMPWPKHEAWPAAIDGQPVGPRGHAVFTAFANACGVPALALPAPAAPDGLPIGFQLVGRPGGDELLCAVGAEYEAAHPWAERRPPI